MLKLPFTKYQANGNDLIAIDARNINYDFQDIEQNKRLCNRNFGIGSDGIILLKEAFGYDYEMVYINPEGVVSTLCGNGARCLVHFASKLGIIQTKARFLAIDGVHFGEIVAPQTVKLQLQDGKDFSVMDYPNAFWVDTGSPHFVRFIEESVNKIDFLTESLKIRHSPLFAESGVNINFVNILEENKLKMRSFERGVEGETLSCGTGATAAALCYIKLFSSSEPYTVHIETRGGMFTVTAKKNLTNVWITGPVTPVFEGVYFL